uniref:Carboxylic ester hydrolase n=1 Tax=Timema bartmani TaxID=61472 RepID=A0A7R9F1C5_9NEOP|nr:unnamed protein product [Timema bartmani]
MTGSGYKGRRKNTDLPESTESSLKPVMVWIHGGGFIKGSGTTKGFGPDYLVDEGIVVVTINYRLGVIGFLSLEGTDVASNVGLKDQVAALRWVKQNIAKFGGDPDNVTIFGQSAGGASVNYQVLSPLSAGLFTRAISESGSVFNPWSYMADPRERAFRMGQALGYTGEDDQALVDFLRTLTADELIAAQGKALSQEEKNGGEEYPFVATYESSVSSGDVVFLPDEPIKMMQSGQFNKVPYIIGANSEEYRESATSLNNTPSSWTSLSKSFERYVPLDLGLERGSEQSLQIAEKIRKFYFGDQNMSTSTVPQFCDMETDIMFVKGVYKTSTEFVAHSDAPLYNYQFCYDGRLGVSRVHGSNSTIYGPSHTDELSYIFYYTAVTTPFPENSTEMITLRRMVSIWTNFAKTGRHKRTVHNRQNPVGHCYGQVALPQVVYRKLVHKHIRDKCQLQTQLGLETKQ